MICDSGTAKRSQVVSRHKSHHCKQTHVVPSRPAPTRLHSEWFQITSHAVLAFGTLSKIILSQWLRATLSRMLHALVKLDHVNGVGWRPLKATSCILCECDVVPSCILCECDVVTCMLGLWRLRTCTSVDQNARVALLIKTLVFGPLVGRIRACGCVSATLDVSKEIG